MTAPSSQPPASIAGTETPTVHGSFVHERLTNLWRLMPSAKRKRTARGRRRTCRALGIHAGHVRQLRKHARTNEELAAVDALVAKCERRRAELADDGQLARRAWEEREARRQAVIELIDRGRILGPHA